MPDTATEAQPTTAAPVATPVTPPKEDAPGTAKKEAPGTAATPAEGKSASIPPEGGALEKTAPEAATPPEEESEEDDGISLEVVIDGEKRLLSGSGAIDYMNETIEKAIRIVEHTKRANAARLEKPMHALIDELAAGKHGGNREAAYAEILQEAEKMLLEHLEEQDKPEAERRARQLEAELKAARDEIARQKKADEEEEWREQVAEAGEQIAKDFHETFKALELPDDDDLKGVILERMLSQRRRGLNPTVRAVAEKVKTEMDARVEAAIGRRREQEKKDELDSVRKSREEGESAAPEQKARGSKDGPAERRLLRSRDFFK